MNKSLMISIRPEHAYNIIVGKKTLELRTWIPKDYVGWVYVYVSKTIRNYKMSYYYQPKNQLKIYRLHGNIPFRFWFDMYDEIHYVESEGEYMETYDIGIYYDILNDMLGSLQLTRRQVEEYGKDKELYAWNIKKLEVFDEPKELSEFYVTNKGLTYKYIKEYEDYTNDEVSFRLKKAPQKMQWVYAKELENDK